MTTSSKSVGAVAVVATAVIAVGCAAAPPPFIECEVDSNCNLLPGGACDAHGATGHHFCTYPDRACESQRRWSDLDVEDPISGACVTRVFDVVYATEWRIATDGTVSGFVAFVNTSPQPISLSSLVVRAATDDHVMHEVRITVPPLVESVPPHGAAGALSAPARQLVADGSLMPEFNALPGLDLVSMEIIGPPREAYEVAVDLTLGLDGLSAPAPFVIHMLPGMTTWMDPIAMSRISVLK